MKAASAGLIAHLAQQLTSLTTTVRIVRRDGTVFAFTDHDEDLVIDGVTYVAKSSFARTAFNAELQYAVDSVDVMGVFDDAAITEADLRAGLFDAADIYVGIVNWADLTQGMLKEMRGSLGECSAGRKGVFTAQVDGLSKRLQQDPSEYYQADCRSTIGDRRCRVPLLPDPVARSTDYALTTSSDTGSEPVYVRVSDPGVGSTYADQYRDKIFKCTTAGTTDSSTVAYDYTPGNTTTDGTAVFTCVEAWTRAGVVATGSLTTAADRTSFNTTITEARAVNGWFKYGLLTWETGLNAGISMEVGAWLATGGALTLRLAMPFAVAAGDKFYVWAGCDGLLQTCKNKFDNIRNRQAEDYVPGQDFLTTYADASR